MPNDIFHCTYVHSWHEWFQLTKLFQAFLSLPPSPPPSVLFLWFPALSDIFALLSSFGLEQWSCSGLHIVVGEYILKNLCPGIALFSFFRLEQWSSSGWHGVVGEYSGTCPGSRVCAAYTLLLEYFLNTICQYIPLCVTCFKYNRKESM